MKHKALLGLALAVAATTVLAACASGPTTTTVPTGTTKPAATSNTMTPATAVTSEKPQYGGILRIPDSSDIPGFDEAYTIEYWTLTDHLTNESLLTGDWAKGPAGSGEFSWTNNGVFRWDSKAGAIAESWQIVKPGEYVFHIRHGIHFGLNPDSAASRLVNGRELTADDVVYSINRILTEPTSYVRQGNPHFASVTNVTAPDKYTVNIDVQSTNPLDIYNVLAYLVDFTRVVPHEVVDKYGSLQDWHNSVGSGPFFLTDYVSASSVTFRRNPNYWGKDPVGPGKGNQLPYLDGINVSIISDLSTQLAALRTAKLDWITSIATDDANSLKNTTPDLKYEGYIPTTSYAIFMRTDKEDLPFRDVRVRQALMMGTDLRSLGNNLVGPNAVLETFPITPADGLQDAYLELDQAPASVQDLYKYNPDQAKKLLAETGYPDGFKTTVVTSNTPSFNVDYLSAIKAQWAKIGVDLSIDVVEQGVYLNIWRSRNYDDLFYGGVASSGTYTRGVAINGSGGGWNLSHIDDQQVQDGVTQMVDLANAGQDVKSATVFKELLPYILGQVWAIPTPVADQTTFWWPWLQGYHGETSPGEVDEWQWAEYVWTDSKLKAQMGH